MFSPFQNEQVTAVGRCVDSRWVSEKRDLPDRYHLFHSILVRSGLSTKNEVAQEDTIAWSPGFLPPGKASLRHVAGCDKPPDPRDRKYRKFFTSEGIHLQSSPAPPFQRGVPFDTYPARSRYMRSGSTGPPWQAIVNCLRPEESPCEIRTPLAPYRVHCRCVSASEERISLPREIPLNSFVHKHLSP